MYKCNSNSEQYSTYYRTIIFYTFSVVCRIDDAYSRSNQLLFDGKDTSKARF